MHLECRGSGDPILFIHGYPTSNHLWTGIIERLLGQYTCFAVDLPGLGKSPKENYGPNYLQSLAESIEELRIENKIEKWHVVGHDAGSAVAVHYAHCFEERVECLALLSPALFPELKPFYLLEALRMPVIGELLAPVISWVFWKIAMQRACEHDKEAKSMVRKFQEPFSGFSGSWRFMRMMRWGKPEELLAELPSLLPGLKVPTLIFQGLRDAAIPMAFAEQAASLMPNASRVNLDTGHFIPLNRPESVATSLSEFFTLQSSRRDLAYQVQASLPR